VVAVLTLALGIGANTAIYSLLDQALLRRLPVQHPERLVMLQYVGSNTGRTSSYGGDDKNYFSYPLYKDIRDRNSVFSGVIATDAVNMGVQWHGQSEVVGGELVSGNYFEVLGVRPTAGRLFVSSDDQTQNANPVVVLSFSYWKRAFASDPNVVGQNVLINGHPYVVLGVAQPGFHSVVAGQTPDVFAPMMMKPQITPDWNDLDNRRSAWLNIIARLKPGVTAAQAEAGINPLWYSIRADELKDIKDSSESFRQYFVEKSHLFLLDASKGFSPLRESMRTPLLILMGMVVLVALMACANVASLLLVRAASRVREMSVRYALGAERTRIIRQLLVEGLLLGLSGGLLGVLVAPQISIILAKQLTGTTTGELPFSPRLDLQVLLFNFGLAVLVSVIFSLAPAIQFWKPDLMSTLKQQVVTAGGPLRFRRISVAVQIGLSLLLLVGAGLFVRTLRNLKTLDLGFAPDHLVTFKVDPKLAGYTEQQTPALYQKVLERIQALPGVRSVGATNSAEINDSGNTSNITVAGYKEKPEEDMNVQKSLVTPGYFSTLQVQLLAGRVLTDSDNAQTAKVVVVNEKFAKYFFGSAQQALGHYFGWGGGNDTKIEIQIVGVVKDAKHRTVRGDVDRTAFEPYLQTPGPDAMAFYIRTSMAPENVESSIHAAMQTLDSKLVLDSFVTMEDQIDTSLGVERMIALLATSFAGLALFMAAVGLYGVLAYSTAQRTREIGVRMALGASRMLVLRMILMEVVWLAGAGIIVFLPLTLLLTSTLRSQLYGISSNDPWTIFSVTLLLASVAMFSALIPARRAAKVEPMIALRYE
ncbi:MAG TPA: ABC transporter permease, partial [Terriglobales bacterium]|nr:ABC transporter permease [Terriglobales bacterium]